MIVIPTMPPDMNEEECRHAVHTCTVQCIRQITMTFITVISMLLILLNTNIPEPYHTPILYGQGWVNELLEGHPEHICCELGVSCEVFLQLIISLHSFSFGDSKYVQLEEQLAIFLYMSVTGLTIWHTGELSNIPTKQAPNISIRCSESSLQNHFTQHTSTFPT